MPMVNTSFIGYDIDLLFEYYDRDGDIVNVWFQEKVVSIANKNKNLVDIKWKEECLSEMTSEHWERNCLKEIIIDRNKWK